MFKKWVFVFSVFIFPSLFFSDYIFQKWGSSVEVTWCNWAAPKTIFWLCNTFYVIFHRFWTNFILCFFFLQNRMIHQIYTNRFQNSAFNFFFLFGPSFFIFVIADFFPYFLVWKTPTDFQCCNSSSFWHFICPFINKAKVEKNLHSKKQQKSIWTLSLLSFSKKERTVCVQKCERQRVTRCI